MDPLLLLASASRPAAWHRFASWRDASNMITLGPFGATEPEQYRHWATSLQAPAQSRRAAVRSVEPWKPVQNPAPWHSSAAISPPGNSGSFWEGLPARQGGGTTSDGAPEGRRIATGLTFRYGKDRLGTIPGAMVAHQVPQIFKSVAPSEGSTRPARLERQPRQPHCIDLTVDRGPSEPLM